jgi:adenylosuccinate lyase
VALWHERDISHSSAERVVLPDATLALDYMLAKTGVRWWRTLVVFPQSRCRSNLDLTGGLIHSQQVLLLLTEKGRVAARSPTGMVQRNGHAEPGRPRSSN